MPVIYLYVSASISAASCAYDARSRMRFKPSFRNIKLGLIAFGAIVAAIYSFGAWLWLLAAGTPVPRRLDWLLLAYILVAAIALGDTIACLIDRWNRNKCMESE